MASQTYLPDHFVVVALYKEKYYYAYRLEGKVQLYREPIYLTEREARITKGKNNQLMHIFKAYETIANYFEYEDKEHPYLPAEGTAAIYGWYDIAEAIERKQQRAALV